MPPVPPDQRSPYGTAADVLDVWLSFDDLRRAGIVDSWKTLRDWQRDQRVRYRTAARTQHEALEQTARH